MSAKPAKGLGKGLGSLLGEYALEVVGSEDSAGSVPAGGQDSGVRMIRIIDIEPGENQPRRDFNEERLAELADSIAAHGMIQPIAVRRIDGGRYQIIAGERRWRAARMAGIREVPAVILDADELHSMELAMIENLQREDLNPIEEAEGYRKLITDYGLTQEEVAERVGKSRSVIANAVRLLSLDPEVLELLRNGSISSGHARALLSLSSVTKQRSIAEKIVKQGLSVRQVETLVKKLREEEEKKVSNEAEPASKPLTIDYIEVLQKELGDRIGRKVKIVSGKKKGRIEIEYYGNDDLNNLVSFLSGLVINDA